MPGVHLGPIRSQSEITSVQLLCTRSIENFPDSFVIVPAILHAPVAICIGARIAMNGRNRLQVPQKDATARSKYVPPA